MISLSLYLSLSLPLSPLTSLPGQPGCLYKGQVYGQDAAWDDGCDYKCRCVDAKVGQYQCDDKCVLFVFLF